VGLARKPRGCIHGVGMDPRKSYVFHKSRGLRTNVSLAMPFDMEICLFLCKLLLFRLAYHGSNTSIRSHLGL